MKKMICVATIMLLLSNAFSQTSKLLRYLPANTEMILLLNPAEVSKKIPGELFRNSWLYKDMMKKDNADLKAFWADPSISGIDLSSDVIFSMVADATDISSAGTFNLFARVKNKDRLYQMIRNMIGKDDEIKKYGDIQIVMSGGIGPALAWNNEVVVITNSGSKTLRQEMLGMWEDADSTVDMNKKMAEFEKKAQNIAKEHCIKLLTPGKTNAFQSNARMNALLNEKADIRTWSNGAGFLQSLKNMSPGMAVLFGKMQAITGSEKFSLVNFENGKIRGITHNYVTEKIAALYSRYPTVPQNTGLAMKLPGDSKLIALVNYSAHPEMAKEMFRQSGLGELLDSIKQKLPFDPQLLTSSIGNDAMIAVVNTPGLNELIPEDGVMRKKMFGGLQVIIAIPIKDKAKFDELYTSLSNSFKDLKTKMKQKEEVVIDDPETGVRTEVDFMAGIFNSMNLHVKYNDKLCVISGSEKLAEAFLDNPDSTPIPVWLKDLSAFPMSMRFDMKEFIRAIPRKNMRGQEGEDKVFEEMFGTFGDITVSGGDFSNGSVNSRVEFNFGDPGKNSLLSFFEFVNKMAETSGKQRQMDMSPPDEESKVPEKQQASPAVIEKPKSKNKD